MLLKRCCCELRSGALAVAIVFLSLSVAQGLGVLIGWGAADADWADRSRWRQTRNSDYGSGTTYYYYSPALEGVEILAPLTVFVILQLTFDALLLHGVRLSTTRPSSARRYLVSWIIFRAVMFSIISLGSVGLFITAIILRYTGSERESVPFGGSFVSSAIVSGLFWYSWVVVLSFYWQLREPEATGVIFSRIQTEETAELGPRQEGQAAAAAAAGGAASQVDGGGKNVGQKWV